MILSHEDGPEINVTSFSNDPLTSNIKLHILQFPSDKFNLPLKKNSKLNNFIYWISKQNSSEVPKNSLITHAEQPQNFFRIFIIKIIIKYNAMPPFSLHHNDSISLHPERWKNLIKEILYLHFFLLFISSNTYKMCTIRWSCCSWEIVEWKERK